MVNSNHFETLTSYFFSGYGPEKREFEKTEYEIADSKWLRKQGQMGLSWK